MVGAPWVEVFMGGGEVSSEAMREGGKEPPILHIGEPHLGIVGDHGAGSVGINAVNAHVETPRDVDYSHDDLQFLLSLTDNVPLRAVLPVKADGKKILLPIDRDGSSMDELLIGHLQGCLPPVWIKCKSGREWTEGGGISVAACPVDAFGLCHWIALDFDAQGHGHTTTATAESARDGANAALVLLQEAGLPGFLASSSGGLGRHVWVNASMPVDMAVWLVGVLRDLVHMKVPTADIEVRPGSVKPPGSPLILPLGMAYRERQGGMILARHDGKEGALHAFEEQWKKLNNMAGKHRTPERTYNFQAHAGDRVRSADISLVAVLEALTTITERHGSSFRAYCPNHKGSHALTGDDVKRVWKCWECERGGGGDGASYTLAKFLMGDPSSQEVFARLKQIAKGSSHV